MVKIQLGVVQDYVGVERCGNDQPENIGKDPNSFIAQEFNEFNRHNHQ